MSNSRKNPLCQDSCRVADEEGKLTEGNEAFCSMLGYTREELLSLLIPDLDAIENEDDVAAHIAELIEQGHVRFDTRHRRKDRTEIDVEIQATYRVLEVDAKNVDLSAVLSEVPGELEAVAARRNVEVATSLGGVGIARADERRIRQVLSILLSSAVERSPTGGQVTVQCEPGVADRLEIFIADGGPGMEPDVLDRIFEPFESRGSGRGGRRTGEGIALARSLLVAMGGDITAESVPGEGTVFRLRLPTGEESGAQSDVPRKARTVASIPVAGRHRTRPLCKDPEIGAC